MAKIVKKGRLYFRALKNLMRCRYKPTRFIFLGEEFSGGSIVLSNHEGTDAPMALEMYLDKPMRFWGAYEMNSGLRKLYKYQTRVYYHEKKHWNIHLARLFCLIASPLTWLFYSGLDLISTYKDIRFAKTIKESLAAINEGKSIVIFPEHSEKGYLPELEGFFEGFAVLAEHAARKGIDVPLVVSYFRKNENVYVFDNPVPYSALVREFGDRSSIVAHLLGRCNELGKMPLELENATEISEEKIAK